MTADQVRLGCAFVPTLPPESLPDLARAADHWLDELWIWEDCFKQSGIASAATALAISDRLVVGIGLLPAPLRNVALTTMEIATLARLFPGRFLPGVGHGVQSWMQQAGARVASPLTLLTEYVDAIRRLLDGDTVSVAGRYVTLDEVRLDWPPSAPPPLYLGGQGPKTLELSARLGDGILLSAGLSVEDVAAARDVVTAPWRERHTGPPPIVANVITATGPGAEERVAREVDRWTSTAGAVCSAAGDAAQIAARYREFIDAGATSIVLQPTQDEPDLLGLVRLVGRYVRDAL